MTAPSLRPRRGFTLVELMIAIAILAFVFSALLTALVYMYRAGHTSKKTLFAAELAQSAVEEARGFAVAFLETNPVPIGNYTVEGDSFSDPGTYDPPVYNVQVTFKGYGQVSAAGGSSLTVDMGLGQAPMEPNEFVGHHLMITMGPGVGQIRRIVGNTADTLTVDAPWDAPQPTNASRFRIDGGVTIESTVTWADQTRVRTFRQRSLVIPRN
jgi:prepilin-type N-terminal cleavage/methylation domain-containing protein